MRVTFKFDGGKALEASMLELGKSISKGISGRALTKAGSILRDEMVVNAPVGSGKLKTSIVVGRKLSRRQSRLNIKISDVEVYVGPGALAQATQSEFGNENQSPQGWAQKAFEAKKEEVFVKVKSELGIGIEQSIKRAARKAAKLKL